jgi:hypothetical protein
MDASNGSPYADQIQRYKLAKHFEKLKISDELWQRANQDDPGLKSNVKKKEWISKTLGLSPYEIEMREALRFAPEILITLVEEGMVMRSAVLMLREARDLSTQKGQPLQSAMESVITIYKAGTRRYTADNEWTMIKPSLSRVAAGTTVEDVEESDTVKSMWSTIRNAVVQISLKKAGNEIDPLALEEANGWFEKEIHRVIDGFTTRIRKNKKKEIVEINRMQYANACKVLGIVPTEVGEEIDVEVAKAAKKSLARRYHPDAGGESTEKYQQVIEAYETVDLYAEQMRRIAKNQNKAPKRRD